MAVRTRKQEKPRQFTFAVLLCRASKGSRDRSEGMVTLDVQEAEMRAWCAVKGYEVLRVFVEDGRSGYKPGTKRPDQEEAIALAKEMGAILVTHMLDRLTRGGVVETLTILQELTAAGAGYASVTEEAFTTAGEFGPVLIALVATLARMESDKKRERGRITHLAKAVDGIYMGGPRPYGYEWEYVDDPDRTDSTGAKKKKRVRGTMHIVESEAEVLREAAGRLLAGESQREIVADFNERRVPTAQGGEWRHQTLRKVLTSPTITGCREVDGALVKGQWPAILDRRTFDAIRANYDGRRNPDHSPERQWMLSGLVTCGRCRGVVRSKFHSKGKRYACVECGVSMNAEAADKYVTKRLLDAVTPGDWKRLRTATKAKVTVDASAKRATILGLYQDDLISADDMRDQLAELKATAARSVEPAPDLPPLDDLRVDFPKASAADRSLVVGAVYPKITLHPGYEPLSERLELERP